MSSAELDSNAQEVVLKGGSGIKKPLLPGIEKQASGR
jgi:hypothetical protein